MRGHNWEKNILVEAIGSAKAQGSGLGLGAHFSVPEVLEKGLRRAEWLKQSELGRRFVGKELRYLFNYMTILNIDSLNTPMKKDIIRVNSERVVKYIFPPKNPL